MIGRKKRECFSISNASIRRLARRGGVKRLSAPVYTETRIVLESFLRKVIDKAIVYSKFANRKTVMAMDVVYALKTQGITIYGFGG